MGLDMYLEKVNRNYFISLNGKLDGNDIWEHSTEVGYWRKANQIHRWFVDAVQNGKDDCGYYQVSKGDLEILLELCKKVKDSITLVEDKESNIKIIENPETAKILLPTQSGFFFGDVEYNEYYLNDIKETIKILKKVLAETDFEREVILYCSSW